jgi:hypothetical protein
VCGGSIAEALESGISCDCAGEEKNHTWLRHLFMLDCLTHSSEMEIT